MQLRTFTLSAGALLLASLTWGQSNSAKPHSAALPQQAAQAPASSSCNVAAGARFNLEPRANAVEQNQPSADFLLNRVAPNDDLIMQVSNDDRGNLATAKWDGSVSGYYVHRSTKADCSVQFEGGLPPFTSQGVTYTGVGNTVVAADPARDAFFVADGRVGPTITEGGIGLFRVSASTLLNPTACPNGTHTAAQAALCWELAPPQLLFSGNGGFAQIAVDERPTNAGTGAGDVYTVTGPGQISLTVCNNSLASCSAAVTVATPSGPTGLTYVKVRPDGLITISYANSSGITGLITYQIFFLTCTPAGAPNPPTCGTPTLVQELASPLQASLPSVLFPMVNINMIMETYPKHAIRAEANGKFTTFLVYDDCKTPFQFQNPAVSICVDAEVVLVTSTDGGATWSSPVSIDASPGHHFFPAISADASTGIVNLAYYSAGSDPFNHKVQVMHSQILPGSTTPGTPVAMTTTATAIDLAPQRINQGEVDFFMGLIARGDNVSGQSHLYASFDSTAVSGTYKGKPLPELNNSISMTTY